MDPIDYSMDDAGLAQPSSSSAPRCQYQHAQPPPGEGSFSSPARDAHHYDPIHNTDSWSQIDGSAGPGRARALPSFQWNPGQFVHPGSWQSLGHGHARLRADVPDSVQPAGFVGVPNPSWNEMPAPYDPVPFTHGPFMSPPSRRAASVSSSTARTAAPASIPSSIPPPVASSNTSVSQPTYPRRDSRSDPQNPPSNAFPERQPILMERSRAARRAERREALQSQLAQSLDALDHPRSNHSEDRSLTRRRAVPTWESDDDDDALADSEDLGYQRHSQPFGDQDDERTLAAIRGSIAAAKKVPSKEALASLERVDLKGLKDSDRVCTICYNDIGVENPDGIIENPIRLPRCKHIFGEKCIKKWFQDSDTCPYCRDKLPSELAVRKTAAFESLRAHRFAAITTQAYRARHHGFPQRYPSNEELAAQDSVIRYTEEEYHYMMTGTQWPESMVHRRPSGAQHRESPETRRRQGRGRAGLNRPISVGSARFVAPSAPVMNHQVASQRAHLSLITPNAPSPTPHRSASPTPIHQAAERSSSHNTSASFPGRASGVAPTEEPSPSVAVGSGVSPTERPVSLGTAPHAHGPYYDHSTGQWYEMFHPARTSLPSIASYRPRMDSGSLPPLSYALIPDVFGGTLTSSNYPPGQNDDSQDGVYGHLQHGHSSQFLN